MGRPVIYVQLWPKNQHVCVELARKHGYDIATLPGELSAEHVAAIQSAGRRCIGLDDPIDSESIARGAQAKLESIKKAVEPHVRSIVGPELGGRISSPIMRTAAAKVGGVIQIIERLDNLSRCESLAGVVLNESDLPIARAASRWCRARGIPSFVLSHGAGIGEAYTVTASAIADFMLFVGERGMDPYLDIGFPRERMVACGNPAWDSFPDVIARRSELRERVRHSMGLSSTTPVIVFGTTWNSKVTALRGGKSFEQTLTAFMRACRALSDSGVHFHAIVKDRLANESRGRLETARIAHEAGFTAYSYATGEMPATLMAADLLVAHQSTTLLEALLADVPAINLWLPSDWLIGPAFDRNDGIPMIEHSDVSRLAETMAALLQDEQERRQMLRSAKNGLPRFVFAFDAKSGERCADAIAARLPPVPRSTRIEPSEALRNLASDMPSVIADVAVEPTRLVRELLYARPETRVIQIPPEELRMELLAGVRLLVLDDQLEKMYDPWNFLRHLRNLIRNDARVVARMSNARSMRFLSDMIRGDWSHSGDGHSDPGRLRFFTRKTVIELFEQTGYRIGCLESIYDTKVRVGEVPGDSTFDIDAGAFIVKNLTRKDLDDLRTIEFLVTAQAV